MKVLNQCITVIALLIVGLLGFSLSVPKAQGELPLQLGTAPQLASLSEQPPEETVADQEAPQPLTATQYPPGKLMRSDRRGAYVSGSMLLEIPRLDLACPVWDGTDDETMKRGVGLFEYAQLPGVSNSNTSIAGHRDIYGCEFYNLHQLTEGDNIYLSYEGKRYVYEYLETWTTDPSDWKPIMAREYACVTLQSCDPIGFNWNRIFVAGRLVDVEEIQAPGEEPFSQSQ